MKKFLLTAILILAVVVSLTAGTMAAYKTEAVFDSDNMVAKNFSWDVVKSNSFAANADLRMAPGDTQRFSVKIENNGESPMAISAYANLSGELANQLTLVLESATLQGKDIEFENGQPLVYDAEMTLTYKVNWSFDADDNDNDFIGKTAKISMKLNGEQISREDDTKLGNHSDGGWER